MLANRIIPQLLFDGPQLIKGRAYSGGRSVGVAVQSARIHAMRGVDELLMLDIMATREKRGPNLALIESLAEHCFTPLSIGGGICKLEQIRDLLNHGADKVVVGAAAFEDSAFIRAASDRFGAQCITVSIDDYDGAAYIRNGTTLVGNTTLCAETAQHLGAGEILLNTIPREGTLHGYELGMLHRICQLVDIPVIASGGCSGYHDMLQAIHAGASAVSAGALFQFTDATPFGAAQYLHTHNIEVRLCN